MIVSEEEPGEAPRERSQRTFCCLLASVMGLVCVPVGMSTIGCGWYTLTTHRYDVVGAVRPANDLREQTLQWVPPGRHLVVVCLEGGGSSFDSGQDSLLPTWERDGGWSYWSRIGVQNPGRDCAALRLDDVRFVGARGRRSVAAALVPGYNADADGWRAFRAPFGPRSWAWEAGAMLEWVELRPEEGPWTLEVDYALRSTTGAVATHHFTSPCRPSTTTITTFRLARGR